jgi:hypothetical protein
MTRTLAGAMALAVVLGLATGAGAGYYTTSRPAASPTPIAVVAAGGPAGQGGGQLVVKPGGGSGNNATIEKVDGTTATVKTGNGSSVDVQLASATLQKQEKIAPADLKVGDNVVGRGEGGEGSITVRNLQVLANAPRVGQGGPGQGGNQPRGFVVGSIAKIDGKTLMITPPNGGAVSATLADDAQIERVAPAQPADLKAGQTVALQRPQGGTGATILTIVSG